MRLWPAWPTTTRTLYQLNNMGIPYRFDPLGTLGASPLPPGYVRVESVESSGTSMDTGIVGDFSKHVYLCDCSFIIPEQTTQQIVLGCGFTSSTSRWGIGYIGATKAWMTFTPAGYGFSMPTPDARHSFRSEDNGWYVDQKKVASGTLTSTGKNWYVGTLGKDNETVPLRLYGTSIFDKESGKMLANYVPCKRLSDGTRHMYDTVRQEFAVVSGNPLTE